MIAILGLGFLIGMQHALEADHVAAVASIASDERSVKRIVRHGAVWGLGHTLTLLLFGIAVTLLGTTIPESLASALELAVGVMLMGLGAHVLYRLYRARVHFHRHRHGEIEHIHAHSHAGEPRRAHSLSPHEHRHPEGLPLRTLVVGMTHGMAGSAALLMLTVASVQSVPLGAAYIGLFGVGSIVGMAALSAVMAVPLSYSARMLNWGHSALQAMIGGATLALGGVVVYQNGMGVFFS